MPATKFHVHISLAVAAFVCCNLLDVVHAFRPVNDSCRLMIMGGKTSHVELVDPFTTTNRDCLQPKSYPFEVEDTIVETLQTRQDILGEIIQAQCW